LNKLIKLSVLLGVLLLMTSCSKQASPLISEVQTLEDAIAQLDLVGLALDREMQERTNELNSLMEVLVAEQEGLSERETMVEEAKDTFELTRQKLNTLVAKKNARSALTDDWSRYHIAYESDKQKGAPVSQGTALTLVKLARNYHSSYYESYGFWSGFEANVGITLIEGDPRNEDVRWLVPQSEYYATETSFREYLSKIFTPLAVTEILEAVVTDNIYEKKAFLSYEGRLYTSLSDGAGFPPMYYERLDKARCLFESYTDTKVTVTLIYPTYYVEDLPVQYQSPSGIEFMKETYELEKTDKGWRVSSTEAPRFN